nr:type II secretion system F family protein [Halanaerobacter jeridensis]
MKKQGYYISNVEEVEERSEISFSFNFFQGVGLKDLVLFSRQFATMIKSGVSLVRSLTILARQVGNTTLQETIEKVQEDVESGSSLSEAMAEHRDVFPQLFISMIAAGETGGVMDEVLEEMADHFERENDLKQQVTSAMAYPAVITLVAVSVVFFLITVVLPSFVGIFSGLDTKLPLPTRVLLQVSDIMSNYWYLLFGGVVAVIASIYFYYQTEAGKKQIDWLLLKTPLIGDLITKISVARFSSTLAILLTSGVSILEGLEVVSNIISNQIISERIAEAKINVSEGNSFTAPLKRDNVFPPLVIQMIKVGEETGNLEEMLDKVSDFYDQEVEYKVESMVSLIEPALILGLGLVVGSIVAAVMLPMFSMMQGF